MRRFLAILRIESVGLGLLFVLALVSRLIGWIGGDAALRPISGVMMEVGRGLLWAMIAAPFVYLAIDMRPRGPPPP